MTNFISKFAAAVTIGLSLTSIASAQQQSSTVVFSEGDNSGALAIAQSTYGKSRKLETAIIDINSDATAEIAVRFPELCADGKCATTVLYLADDQWVEILSTPAKFLEVEYSQSGKLGKLITEEHVEWRWNRGQYIPRPKSVEWVEDRGTRSGELTNAERSNDFVSSLHEINKFHYDLNQDGSLESVITSMHLSDCHGMNACPVIVFDESGKELAKFLSFEAMVGTAEDKLFAITPKGFSSFAYSNQYYHPEHSYTAHSLVAR